MGLKSLQNAAPAPRGNLGRPAEAKERAMKILAATVLVAIVLVAFGCDDSSSVPPSVQQAAVKAKAHGPQAPPRPTTQELVNGPKRRLPLTPLPFSVSVPPSWKVQSLGAGSITVLTGPTPSGEAQIQLTSRATAKKEELEIIRRAAKKEMSQPTTESLSKKTIKADFRKIGEVEVFERQAIGQPGPLTVQDADGREHTETATPFNWTLQMFVPQGDEYALYEMNFVVLTAEQYQQDKQLLQPILDSLQYDVAAAPATTPASVTQP